MLKIKTSEIEFYTFLQNFIPQWSEIIFMNILIVTNTKLYKNVLSHVMFLNNTTSKSQEAWVDHSQFGVHFVSVNHNVYAILERFWSHGPWH